MKEEKKVFFKVALPNDPDNFYIEQAGNMIGLLSSMTDDAKETEEPQGYLITPVTMTQSEFNKLPEFKGF